LTKEPRADFENIAADDEDEEEDEDAAGAPRGDGASKDAIAVLSCC